MAALTTTDMSGSGVKTASVLTLGASDTLTYVPDRRAILVLNNVTGGALTPTIDGDGGSNVAVPGIGDVDVSGGFTFASIGAGVTVAVNLDTIREYCQGTVTITGGTGIEAMLLEY